MTCHLRSPSVDRGMLLFSFDADEETIEVLKAQAALSIIQALREKYEAATRDDTLQRVLRLSGIRANRNHSAYQELVRHREAQREAGQIMNEAVAQAHALEGAAKRDKYVATAALDNLSTSVEDIRALLPFQEHYADMALKVAQLEVARRRIVSPKDGVLRDWQRSDGWVSRGDIIATFGE